MSVSFIFFIPFLIHMNSFYSSLSIKTKFQITLASQAQNFNTRKGWWTAIDLETMCWKDISFSFLLQLQWFIFYILYSFFDIYEFFGTKFESIKVKRIQKNPVKFFSTIPNLNCKCIRPRVRSNCSPLDLKSDALSVWPRSLEVFRQEILWRCVSSYLGI